MARRKIMPFRAHLKPRRAILVGLISFCGLISAASQQSTDSKLPMVETRTDARAAANPVLAHNASGDVPPAANLPGSRLQPSIGSGNPLWAISVASLTATRERPIFSPTRRPPPAVVKSVPGQSPSATPLLALVGAIAGDGEGIAIFLDGTTKGIIRLKTGETHAGWTLQEVKAREAILQKDHNTAVLAIPAPTAK
jgi:general secretion pathway protein N